MTNKKIYVIFDMGIGIYKSESVYKTMVENRAFPRAGISFPIECRPIPERNYFYTVSKDLSLGGVKIISNQFLPKNDTIKVSINLIDKVLNLKARVAWCNQEKMSDRYSTGLEFVETNKQSKEKLISFLNRIFNA